MRERGGPPGPKKELIWIDSASGECWGETSDHCDIVEIHSSGWVFHIDEDQVKICGSYYWDGDTCCVGEAIAIPRVAILKPKELRKK